MQKQSFDEGFHLTLRSGITIYPSQGKQINQILSDIVKRAPAQFVLLVDVTGQIISAQGQQDKVDLISLGSLVAGDLAASQEIARLTGQYQNNQLVLREGQNTHTFILEAGHYLALFAQVSDEVPLGWARMIILKAAQQLAEAVTDNPGPEMHAQGDISQMNQALEEENLSDLFGDALDDLWQE